MNDQKVLISLEEYNDLLKSKLDQKERKELNELREKVALMEQPDLNVVFEVTSRERYFEHGRNTRPIKLWNIEKIYSSNSSSATVKGKEVVNYFKDYINRELRQFESEVFIALSEVKNKYKKLEEDKLNFKNTKDFYLQQYKKELTFLDKLKLLFNAN